LPPERERVVVDELADDAVGMAAPLHFQDHSGTASGSDLPQSPQRRGDIIEMVGTDRIMANSAGDWGKSDPLAVRS